MGEYNVLIHTSLEPTLSIILSNAATFEVKNIPAALYKALGGFATNSVNMTKLESYYDSDSFTATEFFADIEGDLSMPNVVRAMEELEFHSKKVTLLGTYPQERARTVK